jgi:hypothetical protein
MAKVTGMAWRKPKDYMAGDTRQNYRDRHGLKTYPMEIYIQDVEKFKAFKKNHGYKNKAEAFKALMELAVEKGLCKAPSP